MTDFYNCPNCNSKYKTKNKYELHANKNKVLLLVALVAMFYYQLELKQFGTVLDPKPSSYLLPDADNKWALVTGGSSGIGHETARQLCVHRGHRKLLITSRSEESLASGVKKLQEACPTGTAVQGGILQLYDVDNVIKTAENVFREYSIALVILNASPETFFVLENATDSEQVQQQLRGGILSHAEMLRAALTRWKGSQTRGLVVMMSAFSSFMPIKTFGEVYSSTRAWQTSFFRHVSIRLAQSKQQVAVVETPIVWTEALHNTIKDIPEAMSFYEPMSHKTEDYVTCYLKAVLDDGASYAPIGRFQRVMRFLNVNLGFSFQLG